MTDTTIPDSPLAGVTAAQHADALNYEVKAGRMTEAQADALQSDWKTHLPAAASTDAAAAPPGYDGGWSADAQRRAVDDLVKHGQITPEEGNAMLKAGGVEPSAPAGPDLVGDHLRSLGDAFAPAADPSEFRLPPLGDESMTTTELAEADTQARSWLHTARLPAAIGSSLAEEAARVAAQTANMDEATYALWKADQDRQLRAVWRDEYPQKMAMARKLVAEIDSKAKGLKDFLNDSAAGDSAMVAMLIGDHAHRLSLRGDK
jgi:hypothetical protein